MRLTCPNCGAQYDVPDDAIPPGGRDVQCSNCQQTWFQAEKAPPASKAATRLIHQEQETGQSVFSDVMAETGRLPRPGKTPSDDLAPAVEDAPKAPRPSLNDEVANILREEATASGATVTAAKTSVGKSTNAAIASILDKERNAAPQSAVPEKPEKTQDSRPVAPPLSADETRARIAQMTKREGGSGRAMLSPAALLGSGKDDALRAVPSMNEINATLRARAQANDMSGLNEREKQQKVHQRGFRRGFFMVLLVLALIMLPYLFADVIAANLPQLAGVMGGYVIIIDQLRIWLGNLLGG